MTLKADSALIATSVLGLVPLLPKYGVNGSYSPILLTILYGR